MELKWGKESSIFLSVCLTKAVFVLAAGLLFFIPFIADWYDTVSGRAPISLILCISLYVCDVLGLTAVWHLDRLLKNISCKRLFVDDNVRRLRVISWCCFGVAAVCAVLALWRVLALMIAVAAAFIGLIIRVIKNLMAEAVALREENDLTV